MCSETKQYMMELLGDEHRRILCRKKSDYVTGRILGIEKFTVLVTKHWDTDVDIIDDICSVLLLKAVEKEGDVATGFIRSIERCRRIMWYISSGVVIEFPTAKQLFKIKQLEEAGHIFEGITREEASSFITDFS